MTLCDGGREEGRRAGRRRKESAAAQRAARTPARPPRRGRLAGRACDTAPDTHGAVARARGAHRRDRPARRVAPWTTFAPPETGVCGRGWWQRQYALPGWRRASDGVERRRRPPHGFQPPVPRPHRRLHEYAVAAVCKGRALHPFTAAERAARSATRGDRAWGPTGAELRALAAASHAPAAGEDIVATLRTRLAAPRRHWRRAFKALAVAEAVAVRGGERASADVARLAPLIESEWSYCDVEAVRERARSVASMLRDGDRLRAARASAAAQRGAAPPGFSDADAVPDPTSDAFNAYWRRGPLALPAPEAGISGRPEPDRGAFVAPATTPPRSLSPVAVPSNAATPAFAPAPAAAAPPAPDLMSFDEEAEAPAAATTTKQEPPGTPPPSSSATAVVVRTPVFTWHPVTPPPPPPVPPSERFAALAAAAVAGVSAAAPGSPPVRPGRERRPPMRAAVP